MVDYSRLVDQVLEAEYFLLLWHFAAVPLFSFGAWQTISQTHKLRCTMSALLFGIQSVRNISPVHIYQTVCLKEISTFNCSNQSEVCNFDRTSVRKWQY